MTRHTPDSRWLIKSRGMPCGVPRVPARPLGSPCSTDEGTILRSRDSVAQCGREWLRATEYALALDGAWRERLARRRLTVVPRNDTSYHAALNAAAAAENRALAIVARDKARADRIALEARLDAGEVPDVVRSTVTAETVRLATCGHAAAIESLRNACALMLW